MMWGWYDVYQSVLWTDWSKSLSSTHHLAMLRLEKAGNCRGHAGCESRKRKKGGSLLILITTAVGHEGLRLRLPEHTSSLPRTYASSTRWSTTSAIGSISKWCIKHGCYNVACSQYCPACICNGSWGEWAFIQIAWLPNQMLRSVPRCNDPLNHMHHRGGRQYRKRHLNFVCALYMHWPGLAICLSKNYSSPPHLYSGCEILFGAWHS